MNFRLTVPILLLALCSQANAAFVHGDFEGDCVDFLMVTETNTQEPDLFYGTPEALSDTLLINPTNFRAEVGQGPGNDFLDSQLEMMIMANQPGSSIQTINYEEFGDYFLAGNSEISASLHWFLNIPGAGTASGTLEFNDSHSGPGITTRNWNLALNIDLVAGTANGAPLVDTMGQAIIVPDDVDKVTFEFDNMLFATAADTLSSAFIAKKATNGIQVQSNCVPEPATFSVAGVLLLGLMMSCRIRMTR